MTRRNKQSTTVSRRKVIVLSTASVITTVASANTLYGGQLRANQQPWYATMCRCRQINFNERDPLTMDVNAWAAGADGSAADPVASSGQ